MPNMERQAIEAALTVIRPTTPPAVRSEASSSLERWCASSIVDVSNHSDDSANSGSAALNAEAESCWSTFAALLRLFFSSEDDDHRDFVVQVALETSPCGGGAAASSSSPPPVGQQQLQQIRRDASGAKLLLITLLNSKVRREYRALLRLGAGSTSTAGGVGHREQLAVSIREGIFAGLASLSHAHGTDKGHDNHNTGVGALLPLVGALCSAAAAVAVRSGGGVSGAGGASQSATSGMTDLASAAKSSVLACLMEGRTVGSAAGQAPMFSMEVSLKLLMALPDEMRSTDWPSRDVDDALRHVAPDVLHSTAAVLASYLQQRNSSSGSSSRGSNVNGGVDQRQTSAQSSSAVLSLKVLSEWIEPCRVTPSELNQIGCSGSGAADDVGGGGSSGGAVAAGGGASLLTILIELLSQPSQSSATPPSTPTHHAPTTSMEDEEIYIHSSRALSTALRCPMDAGTESRRGAVSFLLASIPHRRFMLHPLHRLVSASSSSSDWSNHGGGGDDDGAASSLSDLASTLCSEECESISRCADPGSTDLLELLLHLQSSPNHGAALAPLEAWLALQDVPRGDRHPTLTGPLFERVVDVLVTRCSFPSNFTYWDECDGDLLDRDEFYELRRLSTDVLVGCYFLLRVGYLERLAGPVVAAAASSSSVAPSSSSASSGSGGSWEQIEAALFGLCAVGREACARVKAAQGGGDGRKKPSSMRPTSPTVAADGEATAVGLVATVQALCSSSSGSEAVGRPMRHPLVSAGISNFVGVYAPVWNVRCDARDILSLLSYLRGVMATPPPAPADGGGDSSAPRAAMNATRLLLIGCGGKLAGAAVSGGMNDPIAAALSGSMDAALTASHASSAASSNDDNGGGPHRIGGGGTGTADGVAEGCARLCMQMTSPDLARECLKAVSSPVLQRARAALDVVRRYDDGGAGGAASSSGAAASQLEAASKALSSCLRVLREIVRFCDDPAASVASAPTQRHPLSDVLSAAWPILSDAAASAACRRHEDVLTSLLGVQGQLLGTVPSMVAPHFSDLVTFVVRSYEESHWPCALDYVAAAVESFGGGDGGAAADPSSSDMEGSFNQLLAHLGRCTYAYVSQEKRPNECPQLIRAFFDMARRYLLFCPGALVACPEFASIFSLAVACLSECRGERESTRAALLFLCQLVGWRSLRLPPATAARLERSSADVDASLLQHGESITKACVGGLSGGAPQTLWPVYSDCLYAVVTHVLQSSGPQMPGEENTVAHAWVYAALADGAVMGNARNNLTPVVGSSVLRILCGLAREGPKGKPRAKMLLTDFGKICKGEATPDSLLAYTLA